MPCHYCGHSYGGVGADGICGMCRTSIELGPQIAQNEISRQREDIRRQREALDARDKELAAAEEKLRRMRQDRDPLLPYLLTA